MEIIEKMPPGEHLREKIRSLQAKDEATWNQEYESIKRYIVAVVYRLGGLPEDAEDIAQKTLAKIFTANLDPENFKSSWLARVATNSYIDLKRNLHTHKEVSLESLYEDSNYNEDFLETFSGQDDVNFVRVEQREEVTEVMNKLSPFQREVVSLYAVGFSQPEICLNLSVSQASVRNSLHRLRIRLSKDAHSENPDSQADLSA